MRRVAICVLVSYPAFCLQASGQSVITTVAGSDWVPAQVTVALSAPLVGVSAVAVGSQGNIYVAVPGQVFVVGVDGSIRSVAGTGNGGFSGDGGPATAAELASSDGTSASSPRGLALDSSGNLFIADTGNNRIRKVSPNGIITTVAGTGGRNISGDGGPATAAELYYPNSIAVDGSGDLFMADYQSRIRKVSASGIITTVAGVGGFGFSGDGGPATSAAVNFPAGVAVDSSGNLFIADTDNNRIRKVSANGIITTVAGNGDIYYSGDGVPATSATLRSPSGIALDGSGNLFIADQGHNRIRKVSASGIITTVAGNGNDGFSGDGGPATSATFNTPSGIAVDAFGDLFIADTGNERVRKVSAGGIVTTVAGTPNYRFSGDGGPATSAWLWGPYGVAVDSSGNLFIADTNNRRIRKVTPGGIITTVAGNGETGFSGDGGPATAASLGNPSAVALDGSGNVFIADADNLRVRKVSANGIITTVAGNGTAGFSGDGGPATKAQFQRGAFYLWNFFGGIAVDRSGNLFIADTGNQRVRKVSPDGIITTIAGNGATTGEQIFTKGVFAGDGGPATAASLSLPTSVAVDAGGNLFVADYFNYRIRKVSSSGIITTVAGNGTPGFSGDGGPATSASLASTYVGAYGVAVDSSGNLFIADTGNSRIRKVFTDGIITTVAGGGTGLGDGGPPTAAGLSGPKGVAVDGSGNVLIAETGNNRIRKASLPPSPTIDPGGIAPVYSTVPAIQPGEWVSIFGANLASSTATWTGDFPASLGGASVTIDGRAAALSFVSPGQINLQAPDDTASGAVPVVVTTAGGVATATVTLAKFAPSFLLLDSKHVAGIILRSNGSGAYGGGAYDIIGPAGNSLGYPTVAAKAGDSILLFAVGLGPTSPAVPAGQAFSGAAPTTNPVNVLIDNVSVTPAFAGVSGAGLYQINLTVPAGLGTGDVSLAATVGGVRTPATVVISLASPAAQ